MEHKAFVRELERWLPRWVERKIIDETQREALMLDVQEPLETKESVTEPETLPPTGPQTSMPPSFSQSQEERTMPPQKTVLGWLPAILIGLATILLCVGIMLFYAANWRKMPPAFKLLQVFGLQLGLYAGSYYFLALKQTSPRIGRALLFLGMVTFGASISLIAQIYHISAHPTNGVLVWLLAVLLMSALMRDRWGAYLAALLALIWHTWEFSIYFQINPLFLPLAAAVLGLFLAIRERFGVALSFALFLYWLGTAQISLLSTYVTNQVTEVYVVLTMLALPVGICVALLGRWMHTYSLTRWGSWLLTLVGWMAIFTPMIGLSWPIKMKHAFPFATQQASLLTFEYFGFLLIAAGLQYWLHRRGQKTPLLLQLIGLAALLAFVPLGNKKVLLTTMHVILTLFLFTKLYYSYTLHPQRSLERFLAFTFVFLALFIKLVGFFFMGFWNKQFYVAYVLGFAMFTTVCFLSNQLLRLLLQRKERTFPAHILSGYIAVLAYICFYALSFKLPKQASIMTVDSFVLVLLFTFIGLAVALYAYLLRHSPDTILLLLSALAFLCVVAVMFLADPSVPWSFYPVVFNLLLFVLLGTLIYYSTKINSKALVNTAIAGFVLQMLTRYFDLLWDMLSGSLLFIITGALVLAGGYLLEKSRRNLLEQIDRTAPLKSKGAAS